jgi:hypothetical protein
MRLLPTAAALLVLVSCRGTDAPAPPGDEEKFVRVYAKLVMMSSNPAASPPSTPEQVLADEQMTADEFRKIVADYNRDPRRWESVIEKVQKIVEDEVARSAASVASPRDSTAAAGFSQPSR